MSTPKRYLKAEVYEALAPQYVSGLLRGKARERFVCLKQRHAVIAEEVAFWEHNLDSLNERLKEVEPSPIVMQGIEQRLSINGALQHGRQSALNSRSINPFQRWLSNWWMGAGGLVASLCLISALLWQNTQVTDRINYVAVLENSAGNAQWLATSSKVTRKLKLEQLGDSEPSTGKNVVWAISKTDGSYYRFGEVGNEKHRWITLNEEAWQKIKTAKSLIITQEKSADLTHPEGIVLAKGLCVQINYKDKKTLLGS